MQASSRQAQAATRSEQGNRNSSRHAQAATRSEPSTRSEPRREASLTAVTIYGQEARGSGGAGGEAPARATKSRKRNEAARLTLSVSRMQPQTRGQGRGRTADLPIFRPRVPLLPRVGLHSFVCFYAGHTAEGCRSVLIDRVGCRRVCERAVSNAWSPASAAVFLIHVRGREASRRAGFAQ